MSDAIDRGLDLFEAMPLLKTLGSIVGEYSKRDVLAGVGEIDDGGVGAEPVRAVKEGGAADLSAGREYGLGRRGRSGRSGFHDLEGLGR